MTQMIKKFAVMFLWLMAAAMAGIFAGQLVYMFFRWPDVAVNATAFIVFALIYGVGILVEAERGT